MNTQMSSGSASSSHISRRQSENVRKRSLIEKFTGRSCCVPLCTSNGYNNTKHGKSISFFKFPQEKKRKRQWIHKIRRDEGKDFCITKNTVVCSEHFKESDIEKKITGRRQLKPTSIPQLFPWSKEKPERRQILKTVQLTPTSSKTETENTIRVPKIHAKTSEDIIEEMKLKICSLEKEKEALLSENALLTLKQEDQSFSMSQIKDNDKLVSFYTGFPKYEVFEAFYNFLDVGENGENIIYWNQAKTAAIHQVSSETPEVKRGRKRSLKPVDELFLTLIRLRLGLFTEDLAFRFYISASTVSRICITWINYMYLKLGTLDIWPSKETVQLNMPNSFKDKYPDVRLIIDATEIKVEQPSSLVLQSEVYSSYKSHCTLKGLIGIIPSGPIVFTSQLYTGSISDRELVIRSGLLSMPFDHGDAIMADKGFSIDDLLAPLGLRLNIPPFLGSKRKFSPEEVLETQQIAAERVHVERAINVIKNFHIFDGIISLSIAGSVNQMWSVCCMLTNLQNPILSGD